MECVKQSVRDVMSAVNMISSKYLRSTVNYCLWYRERQPTPDTTYAELITRTACHCCVHMDWLAPELKWEVVEWKG